MAVGGEGAPLVPYSEFILYRKEDEAVALQNIGGIGMLLFYRLDALLIMYMHLILGRKYDY